MGQVAPLLLAWRGDPREASRRLGTARRRLFLIRTAVGLVTPALLWWGGISAALWNSASSAPPAAWAGLLYHVAAMLALLALVGFPFAWYSGFHLAHAFGLSRQTFSAWLVDWLKAAAIGLLLGSAMLLAFYGTLAAFGARWWLAFGVLGTAVAIVLTFVAPYVLLPLFYRPRPLSDPTVVDEIRRLADAARTAVRDVCTLDFSRKTVEANAAVIGLGPSRRVVLADTLLSEFTLPEIRTVVAHELGHHVHRDMLRLLLIQGGLLWAGLLVAALLAEPLLGSLGASGGLRDPASLPLLLLGAELFGLATMPLANGLSRRFEAEADEFALSLTRDGTAFASALRRLADQNLAELQPPRWAELLLASHPPIARRIARAEEDAGVGAS